LLEGSSDSKEAFTLYGLPFQTVWNLWILGQRRLVSCQIYTKKYYQAITLNEVL